MSRVLQAPQKITRTRLSEMRQFEFVLPTKAPLTGKVPPAETTTTTEEGGDGYLQRVAKFIPAEVAGFFLFVNNILQQADKPDHTGLMAGVPVHTISILTLIVGLILTPTYIYIMREEGDA